MKKLSLVILAVFALTVGITATAQAKAKGTPSLEKGEELFTKRCSICHTKTGEKMSGPGGGPGLLGVAARRNHDWLVEWISNPNKVFKEMQDETIKMKLEQQIQDKEKTSMISKKLTPVQVESIILYLNTFK
ncbi:MAG: c-type cytochrome [Nitrospinae bacterium]|nr:c-type cytochrome [Nitrospinota bacterium]